MVFVQFLNRHATWKNTIVLLLAQFVIQGLILFWLYPRIGGAGVPLDMRSGLSVPEISGYLTSLGQDGRKIYALNEWTLDVLYPLLYAPAYAFLLLRLITPLAGAASRWLLLGLLPFAIAIADLCENASIIGAITGSVSTGGWARSVIFFNTIKGSFIMLSIAALFVVLCMRLVFFVFARRGRS